MKKTLDCVEMKRKGQELLQKRLAGMTPEEQRAFWADESRKLRERVNATRPGKKSA